MQVQLTPGPMLLCEAPGRVVGEGEGSGHGSFPEGCKM